ncbi:pyruvate formate lyase family protein, partial [Salmonella enterica]|uniref:pyruvate formate lyase family protein n=1 Tax=Salmonella enterica TaxID=28901 RepID=UPI00398C4927
LCSTSSLRAAFADHLRSLLQIQVLAQKSAYLFPPPARNAQEEVQGLYLAYLAAVKSQNGGAMSLGRTAPFLDI